ncbi:class I histocompatibility antigen, F10 alpha chain-like [Phyllobates terribilis]|uniref:class I histocompatibility antigen, F10 alpha chain-like n=1 Tax=Phyllobates terribilis TaxID=111132 RepID=UPI003CCB5D30
MGGLLVLGLVVLSVSGVYSHSLRYYYMGISVPGPGLPAYSSIGYVDDREIVNYNSDSGRTRPKVQWMEKLEPEYWEEQTEISKQAETAFRLNVKTLMERFNQTGGFHIVQVMSGCELRDDGGITGYSQYGYDGREFLALDTRTWTFVPTMAQAQITAQRWNSPDIQEGERNKNYLENICIEYLKKHVENGREDLERRVRPQVKVSAQEKGDTMKLHCQVYGFHPRAVDVKWMKNKEDEVPSYETTHVLPNPDGTYQIRVSAEVTPKDGDRYSCYVDHSSLEKALYTVWEPEKSRVWVIAVVVAVVAVALLGIGGFILCTNPENISGMVAGPSSPAGHPSPFRPSLAMEGEVSPPGGADLVGELTQSGYPILGDTFLASLGGGTPLPLAIMQCGDPGMPVPLVLVAASGFGHILQIMPEPNGSPECFGHNWLEKKKRRILEV